MKKLLDYYHSLPAQVRIALSFGVGAAYSIGKDAYLKHAADVAAHHATTFDYHKLLTNMFMTGAATFVAHYVPFSQLTSPQTSVDTNSPKEGEVSK